MRRAIGVLLVLAVLVWWAVRLPGVAPPTATDSDWRRTAQGWQRRSLWPELQPVRQPRLHPLNVAAFEVLASFLALLAFDPTSPRVKTAQNR